MRRSHSMCMATIFGSRLIGVPSSVQKTLAGGRKTLYFDPLVLRSTWAARTMFPHSGQTYLGLPAWGSISAMQSRNRHQANASPRGTAPLDFSSGLFLGVLE